MVDLAEKTGSTLSLSGAVSSIYDIHGNRLDPDIATQRYDTVWSFLDQAISHSLENSRTVSPHAKMADFFEDKVKHEIHDVDHQRLLRQVVKMWGAFMGNDYENQSLKNFWLEQGLEGGEAPAASFIFLSIYHRRRQRVRCEYLQDHSRSCGFQSS